MSENEFLAATRSINHDNSVDISIRECLTLGLGKSFITFAGAGSGKTYSLKEALDYLKHKHEFEFSRQGKKIAVITFTNNAANEIKDRIIKSPIFAVSTIHSFCWEAISGFNQDIRSWYLEKIPGDIRDLEEKEKKGRPGKASDVRKKSILRLTEKIDWLSEPRSFVYDPNGANSSKNSLSHTDVLKVFSYLLTSKPMMADIIVSKFPFIFIDESQDTDKGVISAFFNLHRDRKGKIVIGLLGDTMQRIFGGGEPALGKSKPEGWIKFNKEMNHRSARRIIGLGNQIRSEDDGRLQFAREGATEGCVRYFLLPQGFKDKDLVEAKIREFMAKTSGDKAWEDILSKETAILLLEHKMASRRLGFYELWDELAKSENVKNKISEGKNTELNFFADVAYPLVDASLNKRHDEFMSLLRKNKSSLLEEEVFSISRNDPLKLAREAEHVLNAEVRRGDISFMKVLELLSAYSLVLIPPKLKGFIKLENYDNKKIEIPDKEIRAEDDIVEGDELEAWGGALETNFFQIENYKRYITDNSIYRTHQGVKGNEFERVMVIMDDDEAGGFLFSYEQYFDIKALSPDSVKKRDSGEEISIDRTRRLFYVTSTRAKYSLAHVIYTSNVSELKNNIINRKFAQECEVITDFSVII